MKTNMTLATLFLGTILALTVPATANAQTSRASGTSYRSNSTKSETTKSTATVKTQSHNNNDRNSNTRSTPYNSRANYDKQHRQNHDQANRPSNPPAHHNPAPVHHNPAPGHHTPAPAHHNPVHHNPAHRPAPAPRHHDMPRSVAFRSNGHYNNTPYHGRHYRDDYRIGRRINRLPSHYRTVNHRGVRYYYYDGIYYRPYGNSYVIVRPPYGVTLASAIINTGLYLVDFAFYSERTSRFVSSQRLARELGLRQSYAYSDEDYFYEDGIYYILNSRGEYVSIVPPAGALVGELPYDATRIVLRGYELYQVDDTIYRLTSYDGQPVFEVLGQRY